MSCSPNDEANDLCIGDLACQDRAISGDPGHQLRGEALATPVLYNVEVPLNSAGGPLSSSFAHSRAFSDRPAAFFADRLLATLGMVGKAVVQVDSADPAEKLGNLDEPGFQGTLFWQQCLSFFLATDATQG